MVSKATQYLFTGAIFSTLVCSAPLAALSQEAATGKTSSDIVVPAQDQNASNENALSKETPSDHYFTGKLQIGTRSVLRVLTDEDSGHIGDTQGSGTFLGTIYALDEEQNYAPLKPFITFYFTQYIGIELAYDEIEAVTLATNYGDVTSIKTDGPVSLSGPTLSLLGRLPNKTAFTPYGGIGFGFFSGDFEEDSTWAGSADGRFRKMDVESETALLLTVGTTYAFTPNWLLDLSIQYVSADADATFFGYTNGVLDTQDPGSFPMDNIAFRLGLVYAF